MGSFLFAGWPCVVTSCADSEMYSSLPFDEWKELRINATAKKVQEADLLGQPLVFPWIPNLYLYSVTL